MELHEYKEGHRYRAMVVMDGRRCVAVAHKKPAGWLLRLHGGCWTHEDAEKVSTRDGGKRQWDPYRHLVVVGSTRACRALMSGLAETGKA